jgi:hypothetical protein
MNAAVSTVLAKPEVSDDDNEPDGMPYIPRAVESPIVIEALVREYREILKNGRDAGVMLGFDVVRVDPFVSTWLVEINVSVKDDDKSRMLVQKTTSGLVAFDR